MSIVVYMFGIPLVLLLMPLLAPGWRALALIGLAGLSWLVWSWTTVWTTLSDPAFDSAFGGAVMFMSQVLATLALISGVTGRAVGLWLQSGGASRLRVIWTDISAISVPLLFLAALQLAD